MPKYAKHSKLGHPTRVTLCIPNVEVCTSMQKDAQVCTSMHKYAEGCRTSPFKLSTHPFYKLVS